MTRIRYKARAGKRGLVILESPPQIRSIYFNLGSNSTVRIPFPYLIQVFEYDILGSRKKGTRRYIYNGVYGRGLCVYLAKAPLKSFSDQVYLSPTDAKPYEGCSCTPHSHDNREYSSPFVLITDILNLWWGTCHYQLYDWHASGKRMVEVWKNMGLDEALKFDWGESYTLRKTFNITRAEDEYSLFEIPKDAVLIDEAFNEDSLRK